MTLHPDFLNFWTRRAALPGLDALAQFNLSGRY